MDQFNRPGNTNGAHAPNPASADPDATHPGLAQASVAKSSGVDAVPGQRLGNRYRLESLLSVRGQTATWRAFDETLSRPVLVHLLNSNDPRTGPVLDAARRAAVATDSRFLRVLDAIDPADGPLGADGQSMGFVVCEYALGQTLQQLLPATPLSSIEAAWVIREVADALAPMHAQGLFHRRLSPDTVLITVNGNVKIVGFLTDAALNPMPGEDQLSWSEQEAMDVRSLGKILYAELVGRWPVELQFTQTQAYGLLAAPRASAGHWANPGHIRQGVSPMLDAVTMAIIDPDPHSPHLHTAADVAGALNRVLGNAEATDDLERRVRLKEGYPPEGTTNFLAISNDPEPVATVLQACSGDYPTMLNAPATNDSRAGTEVASAPESAGDLGDEIVQMDADRSWEQGHFKGVRWLVPLVIGALLVVALIGAVRSCLPNGPATSTHRRTPAITGTTEQSLSAPTVVTITKVSIFDPSADGGDGTENPDQVKYATDGNPATIWHTLTYRGSAKMGNIKPGVGLLIELSQPSDVHNATLIMDGGPTAVAIMVPNDPKSTTPPTHSVKEWQTVASNQAAVGKVTLSLEKPATTQFVLVYLTSLPSIGQGQYRGGIAELSINK